MVLSLLEKPAMEGTAPLATPRDALANWAKAGRKPAATSVVKPSVAGAALLEACKNGDAARVRAMLAWTPELETSDEHGNTPLLWTDIKGHAQIARLLLAAGANPAACNETGKTALHIAWYTQSTAFNRQLQNAAVLRCAHLQARMITVVRIAAWRRRAFDACYAPGGHGYLAARAEFDALSVRS